MKATLNLVDHLLAMGRRYQELGRQRDALAVLTRLSGFRELPAAAAEETQVRLAELHLRRRRYARARRHLTAALRHQPDNARYHYLMAGSLHADDQGDCERAVAHYRRSLELDPGQVRCRADYGLLLVRQGEVEDGLGRLREAVERAPENAEVLGKLVKALRLAGRSDEARSALRAALFRNPRSPRFRKLWGDYQYQELRRQRQAERRGGSGDGADEGPVLLPFVRLVQDTPSGAGCPTILRHDEAEPGSSKAPHLGRSRRRPDQRHVQ
jgi:Tfp pilus assembly protein PilF